MKELSRIVRNNQGLSLLEVVFATAIVMLLLVTLAAGSAISVRNATFARNESQASKLAREEIELIRAYRDRYGYAAIPDTCNTNNCYISLSGGVLSIVGGTDTNISPFTRYFTTSSTSNCDGKNVRVTVQWTQGSSTHRSTLDSCFNDWQTL